MGIHLAQPVAMMIEEERRTDPYQIQEVVDPLLLTIPLPLSQTCLPRLAQQYHVVLHHPHLSTIRLTHYSKESQAVIIIIITIERRDKGGTAVTSTMEGTRYTVQVTTTRRPPIFPIPPFATILHL